MTRIGLASLASVLALAAGCTAPEDGDDPGPQPQPEGRIELRAATGHAELWPAGIAVDSDGERFYFDENRGLYQQSADGRFVSVMGLDELPDPGVLVRPPFTDLVAIGRGRFAITAIGDGYLLDTELRTMRQYFCYVPDGLPEPYDQRTDAVTYDPVTHLIHAQPRTFDETNTLIASQIASYDEDTGVDVAWTSVSNDIAAGGMAQIPGVVGLVLGNGPKLLHHTDEAGLVELADLGRDGITDIAGLAVDAEAGTLLVLDRPGASIVSLDLDALAARVR